MASLADMVLEDDLQMADESKHKLNLIRQRAHRMDKLLLSLQDYAKAGSRPESKGWMNLEALVLGMKVKHQHASLVKIETNVPQQEILTYPGLLEKVLDLLIDNAIRFNDKPLKMVNIEARQEGDLLQFSVRDNGPGIPPEFHQKVFVIFQTLAARDQVDTSGAGLAIARKIVQEQGGQMNIYCDSAKHGCEFRFSWPLVEAPKEAAAQRA
jgi:signal transduction histidine kinase